MDDVTILDGIELHRQGGKELVGDNDALGGQTRVNTNISLTRPLRS